MKRKPIKTVDDLEPLISYYTSLMGEKPGRLMTALSLLADLEFTEDWKQTAPEFRLSIELAKKITAEVFNQLVAEQGDEGHDELADELNALFR